MKKTILYLLRHKKLSGIIILFTGLVIYLLIPKNTEKIATVRVENNRITQSVTASGSVDSITSVNLSFISSGKLIYLGANKGERVEAGQVIAQLDQRTLQKNFEVALTEYSKQQNNFENTNQKYQAGVLEGQQRATLDSSSKQGYSAVPETDLIHDAVQRILADSKNDLQKALNSVELQKLALEQSILTTPVSGILVRADAQVSGTNIGPTTVFTVADPDNLVFNADVDEADIGKITLGQTVNLTLDAYPEQSIPLAVSSIDFTSHKSETGGNVYTVKTTLPANAAGRYRIGMSGDAEIIIAGKQKTLIIPISCLIDDRHVYVKNNNSYEKRTITTGLQSDTDIEVVKGLREGEEVALLPEDVTKILTN